MNQETLNFICWVTGHDEETINQMYNDYSSSPQNKSIPMQAGVSQENGEQKFEIRTGKDGKPKIFLKNYNVAIAEFYEGTIKEQEYLNELFKR